MTDDILQNSAVPVLEVWQNGKNAKLEPGSGIYEVIRKNSNGASEIRLKFNCALVTGRTYVIEFRLFPTGSGSLALCAMSNGAQCGETQEVFFDNVGWTEKRHHVVYPFTASTDDENGYLAVTAGKNGFPRKMEFAEIKVYELPAGKESPQFSALTYKKRVAPDSLVSELYPTPGKMTLDLAGAWDICNTPKVADDVVALPDLSGQEWFTAELPQEMHWVLYHLGKTPFPYHAMNLVEASQWMNERTWYFRRHFSIPATFVGNITLNMVGVDYVGHYWLNGEYLGRSDGPECGIATDVTSKLRRDAGNELIVRVEHVKLGTAGSELLKGHQFAGWGATGKECDTIGLTGNMCLVARPQPQYSLERPFVRTRSLINGSATLDCGVEIRRMPTAEQVDSAQLFVLRVKIQGKTFVSKEQAVTRTIALNASMSIVSLEAIVDNPQLWWINGMGRQDRYLATFELQDASGAVVDAVQTTFGIRLLERRHGKAIWTNITSELFNRNNFYVNEMRENRDYTSDDWNFFINGRPFFANGTNWMSLDALMNVPDDSYRWALSLAQKAGVNMIRAWGGSRVEADVFYELCDNLGILVMQDFPVNITGRGKDPALWEKMVMWHIFRLRNHPSLACWCGGNEFAAENYDNAPLMLIANDMVRRLDCWREFLPSSPFGGDFHSYNRFPDSASLWKSELPDAPFVSESGTQVYATADSWRVLLPENERNAVLGALDFDSDKILAAYPMLAHYGAGACTPEVFQRIEKYDAIRTLSLNELSFATELGAAEYNKFLIEICRWSYPNNGGVLLWVWQPPMRGCCYRVLDNGLPMDTYYEVKRAYLPCRPMLKLDQTEYNPGVTIRLQPFVAVADSALSQDVITLRLRVFDPEFNVCFEQTQELSAHSGMNRRNGEPIEFAIPMAFAGRSFVAVVEMDDCGKVNRNVYYLHCQTGSACGNSTLRKQCRKTRTTLVAQWIERLDKGGVMRIRNTGDKPSIFTSIIESDSAIFVASDNFFWIDAGEEREIAIEFKNDNHSTLIVDSWNADALAVAAN